MLEGITLGFIVSLSLFPGIIWCLTVGMHGSRRQVVAVHLGFALSQLVWLLVAVPGLLLMMRNLPFLRVGIHLFAAGVLAYTSYKMLRTRRAERLDAVTQFSEPRVLFRRAFVQSLAMPMRLPLAMAVLMATGAFVNHAVVPSLVPVLLAGGLIGVVWWWGQLTFLCLFFVRRVPVPITLRSVNKLRPFCFLLYAVLALITLLMGAKSGVLIASL